MRFEKVSNSKLAKFIEEFIDTNYDKVQVFNEDDYDTDAKMVAALRFAAKNHFKDKINISHTNGRVYMIRIDKGHQH